MTRSETKVVNLFYDLFVSTYLQANLPILCMGFDRHRIRTSCIEVPLRTAAFFPVSDLAGLADRDPIQLRRTKSKVKWKNVNKHLIFLFSAIIEGFRDLLQDCRTLLQLVMTPWLLNVIKSLCNSKKILLKLMNF